MHERRARVLLVEDDEDDYVLVRDFLEEIPGDRYSLEWIRDPEDVLPALEQDRHDVVLIDYRLGARNGLDLVQEAIASGCKAPMILLTGQGDLDLDIQAMRIGAADYLAKGRFDARQLERSLRYAIWHRESQEAMRRARDELEDRVRERTAELEHANTSLRSEIAEREQAQEALRQVRDELEDRVRSRTAELERANRELSVEVAERQRAEGALKEREEIFDTFINNSPAIAWMKDEEGRYHFTNQAFRRMFVAEGDSWLGRTDFETWPASLARQYRDHDHSVLVDNRVIEFLECAPNREGLMHDLLYYKFPVNDPHGRRFVGGVAVVVTEERKKEEELKRKSQQLAKSEEAFRHQTRILQSILDSMGDGVVVADEEGRLLFCNPAAREILGTEPSDTLAGPNGDRLREGSAFPPELIPIARAIRGEHVSSEEILVRNAASPGGRWLNLTACPLRYDEGEAPAGGVAVFREITAQKLAEQEILSLNDGLARRLKKLAAMRRIDLEITSGNDLRLTLDVVVDHVLSQLGVDAACILLHDSPAHLLEYANGKGFRTQGLARTPVRLGVGHAGRAAMEHRTIHVPRLPGEATLPPDPRPIAEEEFVAYWAVPLMVKGHVEGVLEVFHRSELDPDMEWHEFLEALAGQAAIAIDNASLVENLQRTNLELAIAYDATIEGWSRALDLRDHETEGHSKRVTEMSVHLAHAMGLSASEIVHVRRGALLHDIGKMGIPDAILLKPGPLDENELVQMRRHPTFAMEMLAPIPFLGPAIDIPYCHHEKWDGTGYPRGLKGEQIPLAARIFAAVDIWDAVHSDRPYRKAWPIAQVYDHIRSLSGNHLDPRVVKAFLPMIAPDRTGG